MPKSVSLFRYGLLILALGLVCEVNADISRIHPIRITNRAQCALDSDKAAKSVFAIIDGFNAGRLSHVLGRNLGVDPVPYTQEAMVEFRLAVTGLTLEIIQKLLSGRLPLLPTELESPEAKALTYSALAKQCHHDPLCPALRPYLSDIWGASAPPDPSLAQKHLGVVDTFTKDHFISQNGVEAGLNCSVLKKFSPFQANLHGTAADVGQLENLARALKQPEKYIAPCFSQDKSIDSRSAAVQYDIRIDQALWDKVGFDFWNSVKIYFSWAWRYSQAMPRWSPRYYQLFRSLDVEESTLFVANGCESLMPPSCDQDRLAMNALRELAKPGDNLTEFDELVPKGADRNLVERGARSVNNDFLSTLGQESASDWVKQFGARVTEQRWAMRNKLFNNAHFYSALSNVYSPRQLADHVESFIYRSKIDTQFRDEMAYLCLEWRLSSDERIDFLRSDIDQLVTLSSVMEIPFPPGVSARNQVAYFGEVAQYIKPFCERLESQKFFNVDGYETNWSGLERWAKELSVSALPKSELKAGPMTLDALGPFLKSGIQKTELCVNPIDCARKVFKMAVDLYGVSQYSKALMPTPGKVNTPDLFNPYSELKSCQVYDPWHVTKKTRKSFIADMLNTLLFGWNPLPIYVDTDWAAPKVSSFNKLVEDGVLKFDPNIQQSKAQVALLADLGPWLGAPCAIHIAPTGGKSFDFYAFNGISINYCDSRATFDSVSSRPGEVVAEPGKEASYCGGCALNFVTVGSAASSATMGTFNPLKFGVYLFRAVYRFFTGMSDPVNIPKTFTLDPVAVTRTFDRYGQSIPQSCVEALGAGMDCYQNTCGSVAAKFFRDKFDHEITDLRIEARVDAYGQSDEKTVLFKVPGCEQDFGIDIRCSGKIEDYYVHPRSLFTPKVCRKNLRLKS